MSSDTLAQWEDRRREHLGGLISLLLALSSGSIAFCGALLMDDSAKFGGPRTAAFLGSACCFILGLLASLALAFSRLQDARITANIVREREKGMTAVYLAQLRSSGDFWGRVTWRLLYFQLGTFTLGACLLLIALWLIFRSKLFPG